MSPKHIKTHIYFMFYTATERYLFFGGVVWGIFIALVQGCGMIEETLYQCTFLQKHQNLTNENFMRFILRNTATSLICVNVNAQAEPPEPGLKRSDQMHGYTDAGATHVNYINTVCCLYTSIRTTPPSSVYTGWSQNKQYPCLW